MSELMQFREEVDRFMGRHSQSPLDRAQRRGFRGLRYYDETDGLRFEVDVERFSADEPPITMQTSTGQTVRYRRWGRFSVTVDGQDATFTVYSDARGHDLFMPFKDRTNGDETYGAGRYLDSHRPGLSYLGDDRLSVDFNYAYNPYCAYSDAYSCPLPPRDNWAPVPIRAGEKNYAVD